MKRLSQEYAADQGFYYMVDFTLRELLNNAAEHGNELVEERMIECSLLLSDEELIIEVIDQGSGLKSEDLSLLAKESDLLRKRRRGLLTITNFGFELNNISSGIIARYKMNRSNTMR